MKKVKDPNRLRFKDYFGSSAMAVGEAIGACIMTSLFMLYLTDYSGLGKLGAVLGSTVLVFARFFDAVNDPLEGWIMDRAKVGKHGKYRPFLLLSTILIAIGLIGLFSIPVGEKPNVVLIGAWVLIFYLLYDIGVAFFALNPMLRTMTLDPVERGKLMIGPRMVSMIVGMVGASLIAIISGVNEGVGNMRTSFTIVITAFVAIGTLISVVGLALVNEKHHPEENPEDNVKLTDIFGMLKTNGALRIRLLDALFSGFIWTFLFATMTYYVKWAYCADLTTGAVDSAKLGLLSLFAAMLMFVPLILGTVIAAPLMKKFGSPIKFHRFLILAQSIPCLLLFVLELLGVLRMSPVPFFLCAAVVTIAIGADFIPGETLNIECMDYEIYKNGRDRSALCNACNKFLNKAQSAVSTVAVSGVLLAIGYEVDSATDTFLGELSAIPTMLTWFIVVMGLVPGVLGAATYDESEWRRVRILKEAGFNAIRSAHNPCSRAMLEACDHYGMYMMDESFDMWYNRKTRFDYGLDFEARWAEDTAEMVAKDYNHPSVIFYSIGNEVAEPGEAKGLDYGKKQIQLIHSLDSTRAVTCGLNLMIMSRAAKGQGIYQDVDKNQENIKKANKASDTNPQNASLMFNIMVSFVGTGMNKGGNSPKVDALATPIIDALDIAGYNYGSGRYPLEEKQHPERIIFGSETFPQDIYKNWEMVKKYPYVLGDFMWTSWDYLGEAGIGAWSYTGGMPFNRPYPWVLAGAGVIDICGTPDGSCRYASTVWGLEKAPRIAVKPVNHPGVRVSKSVWRGTNAIESWAWADCTGNRAEVEVYSNAYAVELLLGGKSLGKKKLKECKAIFKTKYAPEELTAVAYAADGSETGRSGLAPATGKLSLKVHPEESRSDIVYISVEIVGENGIVESNADRKLTVAVDGGELLGFGSANPCHAEQYHTGTFTSYHGRALAVVRKISDRASITVTAEGLSPVTVQIK